MEKCNVIWYEDEELLIGFNSNPHVCVRYILPSSTPDEVKSIKKFPFMNKTSLYVVIFDKLNHKVYKFSIPKGYCFDGASIPRLFWRVIGSNTDNKFLIPALVHDVLCENHNYVGSDRNLSSRVFKCLLTVSGVGPIKAQIMYLAVDTFQRTQGWEKPKQKDDTNGKDN